MGPKVLLQPKSDYKLQSKKNSEGLSSLLYCFLAMILKHAKQKQDSTKNSQRSRLCKRCKKIAENEMMHKEESHEILKGARRR